VLAEATARAAVPFTTSAAAASTAAVLAGGVLQQMACVKLKLVTAVLLAVGAVAAGSVGMLTQQPASKEPVAERPQEQRQGPRTDLYGDALPEGAVARLGTVRFNHGDGLGNLLFTPDGKMIISSGGSMLRLWDAASGKELEQYSWTKPWTDDELGISPDGKMLVFLGQNPGGDILRVWDLAQRKEVRTAQLPVKRSIISVYIRNALSPDGKLAVIHAPDSVHMFDIETAKELCKLPLEGKEVQAAVFAGNDWVITAFKKETIEVWEARTGKSVRQFAHGAPVKILAASSDGRRLATLEHEVDAKGFLDKDVVHVWDLTTGKEKHQLVARPNRWYQNLVFSPDGKLLLTRSIGADETGATVTEVTVWDADTGERLRELHGAAGQFMAVSPDGTRLVEGSRWGRFDLYDLKTGRHLSPEDSQLHGAAASLSAGGEHALTFAYSSISTWDVATNRRLQSIKLPRHSYTDPRRTNSPDGRYALSFTREGAETQILVWDIATGKCLHTLKTPDKEIPYTSAFSPDSSLLATCVSGEEQGAIVRLWDVRTGKEVRSFTVKARARRLIYTPDARALILAGEQTVGIDVTSGKELFSWRKELPQSRYSISFVKDGKLVNQPESTLRALAVPAEGTLEAGVLSGLNRNRNGELLENRIVLYDTKTGRVIHRWNDSGKESARGEDLSFSPDGRLLASADGTAIHLWEVATGKELRTFQGHRGEISSLAFSANGRRLASASNDSTVVIWDLIPPQSADDTSGRKPDERTLAGWWTDLAGDDARQAYDAVWRLAESPEASVPFLRRHVRPVPEPDAKKIRQHITDLDSETFAVREKASKELEDFGNAAVPALREVLEMNPTLELRRRVEQILSRSEGRATRPETLRRLRALHVLEQIGSLDARRLLAELAGGAAYAEETRDAKAALRRSGGGEP
jgi:WD40 repeat protein